MTIGNPTSVEEYIQQFPNEVADRLQHIRKSILRITPDAEEKISYGMPAYYLNGKPMVYFGGFAKHIGLYATPTGHAEFVERLSSYKQGKGSVQFPHHLPLPLSLIEEIVSFRKGELSKASKG